ncbi:MAG: UDP-N-acetylmuramoyl-L-alanine--D-glutamate ligase, partial [Bdellovibrio sp.]
KAIWPVSKESRLAILGFGKTGQASLELLLELGWDRRNLAVWDEESKLDPVDFQDPKALISQFKPQAFLVSPGVPPGCGWVSKLPRDILFSELDLAFSQLKEEIVVGITGSAGKSTTTSLLGEALRVQGEDFFMGGNLGIPVAKYALDLIRGGNRSRVLCLEISSYQLENFRGAFDYSAIVSLHPNHLDRYRNLDHYYETKWRILQKTKKMAFLASDGGDLRDFALRQSQLSICHWVEPTPRTECLALLGQKNRQNHALATKLAEALGISPAAMRALAEFPGLPHRFENCGKGLGCLWINDSKATSVEALNSSLQTALEIFPELRICVLLGGKDKSLNWEKVQSHRSVEFIFFGEAGAKAQQTLHSSGLFYSQLTTALQDWKTWLKKGDEVLHSPGGGSQDEFKNFEDRGIYFKNVVQNLLSEEIPTSTFN